MSSLDTGNFGKRSRKTTQGKLSKLKGMKRKNPSKKTPFIIGVCGGTASGKTTVCHLIREKIRNKRVAVVSMDSFYKSLTDTQKIMAKNSVYNFDHPDAFDLSLMADTFEKLKKGRPVKIPVYDFVTHSRLGKFTLVSGVDVIILEGILLYFSKQVRELMNMKIFVDTDADTRLVRRIRRDIAERGRKLDGVLSQYEKFVKPSFDEYVLPTKKYADIIIPRGGSNTVAIDLLLKHISYKLEEGETPERDNFLI